MTWQQLDEHPQYEIFSEYDDNLHCYPIRKIGTNPKILKTYFAKGGYRQIYLNDKLYYVHRVIAEQFIVNNDTNKTQVDHINHDRTDNRINNLRWVSSLQNANNKSKYKDRDIEFRQELPDDVIVVNQYGEHHFNGYYFANDVFYRDTGNGNYRIVPWHYDKTNKNYIVGLTDENTMTRKISKNVFYQLYDIDE